LLGSTRKGFVGDSGHKATYEWGGVSKRHSATARHDRSTSVLLQLAITRITARGHFKPHMCTRRLFGPDSFDFCREVVARQTLTGFNGIFDAHGLRRAERLEYGAVALVADAFWRVWKNFTISTTNGAY
jgi:hypothetical protein